MFTASTYEEIVECERQIENMEIVVFLFVKPTTHDAQEIIQEFEYIHYNSGKYCSVYAIGYSNDFQKKNSHHYKKVTTVSGNDWWFSSKAFVEFKDSLEGRINWKYSGESELLILQNNPGRTDPLNFANYVAIDINKGIREGYIDSFQMFMEELVRSAKKNVTAKQAITDVRRSRISIRDTIAVALDGSKKIPDPVKEIMKDHLFYRCANHIHADDATLIAE